MNEAKKLGNVHIVTPDWLWSCAERWAKVDESLFKLSKILLMQGFKGIRQQPKKLFLFPNVNTQITRYVDDN